MVDELVNPYIAGAPVTEARMFFGREDVFDWIQNSLMGKYADHILVIHGQRRVGKTSVLKQLGNRLPKRYIPVFFDLQGRTHTTLDRFLWWLAREITRVTKQDRGIEIPLPDKETFTTDLEYFENQFLSGAISALNNDTLLLTFDEFDNLEESEIRETLARPLVDYLRRLMGRPGLNFIFSIGSSGRKLENMQATYTDFFKTALYKKISFLNEEQTHYLITRPVEGILEFDKPAINRIYNIAGGHPYFTQLTCHELFARCQRTDQRHIRESDVEAVLEDVVERGTVNLKFVWDEASDIEKWALSSLAHLDKPDNRTLAAYLRKQNVRFSESDLTSSLLHLREKDILTSENRFVIHLLRLWLQKNRPIEQVREELTEVNPIANRYIEIGLEFKNSRQYEKAIESFQEALTVSAGNIQAQVSIALVYMDQKAYDKAVGEFEKALAIDDEDVTARSGLCEAHLALGDAATQKGRWKEAAQSYQRVLGINEEHTEARQRMAEIHRQRAEKALTDGRDEEALTAFSDAMKYAPDDNILSARVEAVKAEKKAKVIAAQVARSEKEAISKNWEAAVRTLEEAKSLAPDDSNIQKRLAEAREKLREVKLASLKAKALSAVKAEKFGEALKTWQEYLSLEPKDREKTEDEISRLQKLVGLEVTYNGAQQAIGEKRYDQAISLLKQVIVQDENFKDTSRLLTQAIELRRTSRPARIALPVAKILKGLLITIGIVGLGIGVYFAWSRWGSNLASGITGTPKSTSAAPSTQVAATQPSLDPDIQLALEKIKTEAPLYQTTFDTWEFGDPIGNARIENGKLIIDGKNTEDGSGIIVNNHASDRYAVEFEIRILETVKNGCGFVSQNNVDPSEESWRIIGAGFSSPNHADVGYRKYPDQWPFLADIETTFDFSETNKVTLIIFGNQITAFVNGQLIYSVQNPLGSAIHTRQQLSAGQVVCEYDNFKYWDLSGVDLSASTLPAPSTQVAAPMPTATADPRKLNPANQHLYLYMEQNASWHDARDYCAAQGGYLVTIQDADENEFVYQLTNGKTWLGASDEAEEDIWVWVSNEPWDFQNWEQSEPSHGNQSKPENFLTFGMSSMWNDITEIYIYIPFVCEWEPAEPSAEGSASPILDPAIQIALDAIKNNKPLYEKSFEFSWDRETYNNADAGTRIDDGKLIVIGETQKENRGYLGLPPAIQVSDKFAVEFEFRILESTPGGRCSLANWGKEGESFVGIGVSFTPQGQVDLWRSGLETGAKSNFDVSKTNTVALISFGEQIAAFINGQFAAAISKPDGTNIYGERFFNTTDVIVCEFDNYKIWDLSGVDLNP